jgi:hypothetical protein
MPGILLQIPTAPCTSLEPGTPESNHAHSVVTCTCCRGVPSSSTALTEQRQYSQLQGTLLLRIRVLVPVAHAWDPKARAVNVQSLS